LKVTYKLRRTSYEDKAEEKNFYEFINLSKIIV
jgi:hypothetical protein